MQMRGGANTPAGKIHSNSTYSPPTSSPGVTST
jgi:hypothetical protein